MHYFAVLRHFGVFSKWFYDFQFFTKPITFVSHYLFVERKVKTDMSCLRQHSVRYADIFVRVRKTSYICLRMKMTTIRRNEVIKSTKISRNKKWAICSVPSMGIDNPKKKKHIHKNFDFHQSKECVNRFFFKTGLVTFMLRHL